MEEYIRAAARVFNPAAAVFAALAYPLVLDHLTL
jgi:hypothetical protein